MIAAIGNDARHEIEEKANGANEDKKHDGPGDGWRLAGRRVLPEQYTVHRSTALEASALLRSILPLPPPICRHFPSGPWIRNSAEPRWPPYVQVCRRGFLVRYRVQYDAVVALFGPGFDLLRC